MLNMCSYHKMFKVILFGRIIITIMDDSILECIRSVSSVAYLWKQVGGIQSTLLITAHCVHK